MARLLPETEAQAKSLRFTPQDKFAALLRIMLAIDFALTVLLAVTEIALLRSIDLTSFTAITHIELKLRYLLQATIPISAVVLVIWLCHVYRNLPAFGATNLLAPRWWLPVGFFVPGYNVYHTYTVIQEIWKASDPNSLVMKSGAWKYNDGSSSVSAACWLYVLEAISARLTSLVDPSDLSDTSRMMLIGTSAFNATCLAASSLLGISIVTSITRRQHEKWSELQVANNGLPQSVPPQVGAIIRSPAGSLSVCKSAVRDYPDSPAAHANLGLAYFNIGRYKHASEAIKYALFLQPDNTDLRVSLAKAYVLAGEKPKALDEYKTLCIMDGNAAEELLNIING